MDLSTGIVRINHPIQWDGHRLKLIAAFLKRFGVPTTGNAIGYAIPAPWQSGLSNGASAGGIIGLLINGWAADKYGPKVVMMVSTVALAGFIFLSVFAQNLGESHSVIVTRFPPRPPRSSDSH